MDKLLNEIKKEGTISADRVIRKKIRKDIREFFSLNPLRPPVSLAELERQAAKILERLYLPEKYREFTIIMTANYAWLPVFSSIPYNRRLLLLPQCLRDPDNCRGHFDDMGLVCTGCENCGINAILEEAEKLGYATLVADGTTLAVSLVEEGSIDAVIGVSCMASLKQSFDPVNRAAVPSIALPLLYDGCAATKVDITWLLEEIKRYSYAPELSPVSVSSLKKSIMGYFAAHSLEKYFDGTAESDKLAMQVMSAGGQRMRPLLAVLAYVSYSGNTDEEICSRLSVSIECFHKASLVHDDIQDNAETRYGQPALYRTVGTAMAINVGDYLIGKGYSMLPEMNLEPRQLAKCFKMVSASHLELTRGQGADLKLAESLATCSFNDLTDIYRLKTGEAVKVALLLGALAGNAPDGDLDALSSFSEFFGVAYQLRDDLMEFNEKTEPDNLESFPALMVLLREKIRDAGRQEEFAELLYSNNFKTLRKEISVYMIEQCVRSYLDTFIMECYQLLDKLNNPKIRLSLYSLTGKVFKDFIS